MKIASKYVIYKVYDRYLAPRRIYVDFAHTKKDAKELADLISEKGIGDDGRQEFWGEFEWSGFSIV